MAPRRTIPIWLGGMADVALRRAAAMADGFIFADVAGNAFDQAARLQALLQEAGRSAEEFGFHCNMPRAKTVQEFIDTAARWRDIGGTHAAFSTMEQSFTSVDEHIGHMEKVANALENTDF